jgi:hypothetical protein
MYHDSAVLDFAQLYTARVDAFERKKEATTTSISSKAAAASPCASPRLRIEAHGKLRASFILCCT